jgi:hypothetical protein
MSSRSPAARDQSRLVCMYRAHAISSFVGCPADMWVPFMSGYGWITVLMLPNGSTYYYVSDDDTYLWMDAAVESHGVRTPRP